MYDDYGHHPTAIRDDARGGPPARARPADLGGLRAADVPSDGGAAADVRRGLAEADAVAIADIWAGRDPDTTIASAEGLAAAVAAPPARDRRRGAGLCRGDGRWLAGEVRTGDAVLVMGGGRSYRIGELLLEAAAER